MPRADLDKSLDEAKGLKSEVERLNSLLASTVHKSQHDAAKDELRAAALENERLQKALQMTVSKSSHSAVHDESLEKGREIERLKALLGSMVERSKLDEATDKLRLSEIEVERLKRTISSMVPKEHLAGAVDSSKIVKVAGMRERSSKQQSSSAQDLIAQIEENERLKKLLAGMVPLSQLTAAEDEIKRLKEQLEALQKKWKDDVDRYKKILEDMVPRSDLLKSQDEVARLKAEIDRLQKLLQTMVPSTELDSAKDEIRAKTDEIARLKKLLEGMVPCKQLEAAQERISALKGELDALRLAMNGMASRADLDGALQDNQRLRAELERLQRLLDDMVPKKQYDGIQAEVRALEAQLEALKRQRTQLEAERDKLLARIVPAPPIFSVPGGRPFQDGLQITLTSDDPEVVMYYTLDGSEPGPQNFERNGRSSLLVTLSHPGVVKAVSVSENAKASAVVAEEFREVKKPKPAAAPPPADIGGLGMLLKSIKEENVVLVEDLTPGEPAALSGRIRVGDRLLVVNGVEVSPANFELVSAMIPGPAGTRVDLQLVQAAAPAGDHAVHSSALHSSALHSSGAGLVYSVSLIRSVLGAGRGRPSQSSLVSRAASPGSPGWEQARPQEDVAKVLVV